MFDLKAMNDSVWNSFSCVRKYYGGSVEEGLPATTATEAVLFTFSFLLLVHE